MIYFNLWSLLFVSVSFGLSILPYYTRADKIHRATTLTLVLVFSLSMILLIYILSDVTNTDRIGKWISSIIVANAYAGILKTVELIISGIRQLHIK